MIGRLRRILETCCELCHPHTAGGADLHNHVASHHRYDEQEPYLLQVAPCQEEKYAAHQQQRACSAEIGLLIDQTARHSKDHAQGH